MCYITKEKLVLEYNEYMCLREFKVLINKINVLYSKLKISGNHHSILKR